MQRGKPLSWPWRPSHLRRPGCGTPPPDLVLPRPRLLPGPGLRWQWRRAQRSDAPPLAPVISGLITQQLLHHGESLRRRRLTPRTSARSGGGGEGERRLCTPGREVGGLQIFLPIRDVPTTKDGLGLPPNSVAAVKTLKPCIGVGHVEADLEENTPQPPTWRAKCRWISCRKNTGYHATDPKIRTQGAERGRSWIATKHGDGSLESSNAQRTTERDAKLYPGSGSDPYFLPSCIMTRHLARSTKSWLQSSNWPEVEEPT
jgi:hypothetical protein